MSEKLAPPVTVADMHAQLRALVAQWARVSANKFRTSPDEKEEFGRRFIEHGAVCYFNCANELEQLVKSWNLGPDLYADVLKQDAKSP